MTRTRCFTIVAGLSGLALLTAFADRGRGDDTPKPKPADRTKKEVIEKPTAAIVASSSAPAAPKEDPANPKVKPGDVKWHASFAEACKVAEKSGKPVLLFQLMGKLDDQFC
jgi:hypothetical protein